MGRRRIAQTKSFWFEGLKPLNPEHMDTEVNKFLSDTPGIICTDDDWPDVSWGEVGPYIVCNVSYRILKVESLPRTKKQLQ